MLGHNLKNKMSLHDISIHKNFHQNRSINESGHIYVTLDDL